MAPVLEIDDLSHTYPREVNTPVLDWVDATAELRTAYLQHQLDPAVAGRGG